jgi:hypothetical protein
MPRGCSLLLLRVHCTACQEWNPVLLGGIQLVRFVGLQRVRLALLLHPHVLCMHTLRWKEATDAVLSTTEEWRVHQCVGERDVDKDHPNVILHRERDMPWQYRGQCDIQERRRDVLWFQRIGMTIGSMMTWITPVISWSRRMSTNWSERRKQRDWMD